MKQEEKERSGRIVIRISALLLALTVLGGSKIPVHAASQHSGVMGLVFGFDEEENPVAAVPAFALITESGQVVFSGAFSEDAEKIAFATNAGNTFELEEVEKAENDDFFMWPLGDTDRDLALSDPAFLNWTNPVQNENAEVIYWTFDSDDELTVNSENVRITDLQDYWLDVEGLPDDLGLYPAPILNEDGRLIAMVTNEDTVFTLFDVDQDVFYGGSSGSAPDSGGGGSSGSDGSGNSEWGSGSGGDSKSYGTSREDRTKNVYQELGERLGKILFVMALIAIGVTVFILVSKKRKQGRPNPAVPAAPSAASGISPAIEEIEETRPIDDIGPTLPVEKPEAAPVQTKKLYLSARGGYMDGRIYPVGKEGIRVGRDISNEIHYPKETRGVSRTHCQLYWDEGRLMIMDCNSTSGTFVKGVGPLQPMKPVELKEGDIFYAGEKNNGFQVKK